MRPVLFNNTVCTASSFGSETLEPISQTTISFKSEDAWSKIVYEVVRIGSSVTGKGERRISESNSSAVLAVEVLVGESALNSGRARTITPVRFTCTEML